MQALFFCLIGYTVDGLVYRRTRQHLIQRDKDQGGIYTQNHLRAIVLRKILPSYRYCRVALTS